MELFTEKDEVLVKESWEMMKQNVPHHGYRLSTLIFELAPKAKGVFSYLKGWVDIPQNNPKLKAHMAMVFKVSCESACQLREKGEILMAESTLKRLGSIHLQSGVTDDLFEVVKEALLMTIKEAIGEKWNEDMKSAWGKAYDKHAIAIKAEMQKQSNSELNDSKLRTSFHHKHDVAIKSEQADSKPTAITKQSCSDETEDHHAKNSDKHTVVQDSSDKHAMAVTSEIEELAAYKFATVHLST